MPEGTTTSVIVWSPLVKADSARPSAAVFGPAPGAVKRSSYWSPVTSFGSIPPMR